MNETPVVFYRCEKCGKKLIGRLPNGLWHFVFGRKKSKEGVALKYCPVDMLIHGSIKMKCLNRDCNHVNVLNYFPDGPESIEESKQLV